MCELCDLNSGKDGFIVTICNTCNVPMVVSRQHKPEFDVDEMVLIGLMFQGAEIRWEQGHPEWKHAHCHIFWEK